VESHVFLDMRQIPNAAELQMEDEANTDHLEPVVLE
jgi:hypothetical protein